MRSFGKDMRTGVLWDFTLRFGEPLTQKVCAQKRISMFLRLLLGLSDFFAAILPQTLAECYKPHSNRNGQKSWGRSRGDRFSVCVWLQGEHLHLLLLFQIVRTHSRLSEVNPSRLFMFIFFKCLLLALNLRNIFVFRLTMWSPFMIIDQTGLSCHFLTCL